MPWPVEDRAALQQALEANVEPIWLVYDGGGPASAVVDAAVERPAASTPRRGRRAAPALGDHRRRRAHGRASRPGRTAGTDRRRAPPLRGVPPGAEARHDAGAGAGPWDRGLALLVDLRTHPPEVGAIHRVVRGVGWPTCAPDGVRRRRGVADGAGPARAGLDAARGCRGRRCAGSSCPRAKRARLRSPARPARRSRLAGRPSTRRFSTRCCCPRGASPRTPSAITTTPPARCALRPGRRAGRAARARSTSPTCSPWRRRAYGCLASRRPSDPSRAPGSCCARSRWSVGRARLSRLTTAPQACEAERRVRVTQPASRRTRSASTS